MRIRWLLCLGLAALAASFSGRWLASAPGSFDPFARPAGAEALRPLDRPELAASAPPGSSPPSAKNPPERAPDPGAPAADPAGLRPRTTLLLVGLDRRPDAPSAGLADSLVAVVLEEGGSQVGVVSIPRDLWVTIPGHGDNRINVVPAAAQRQKIGVLDLYQRVLADTLGLPVEHAIVVDLTVFERAVDAVGGVRVDVPCSIVDSFHDRRLPGGRRRLELEAGPALLDGPTAAMFVRSRHGRSDFSRSRRQHAVMVGLRERVLEEDGWLLVPKLVSEFERSLHTDLKRYELLALARRALRVERANLHGLLLTPPLTRAHRSADGKAVLLPDRDAIALALDRLFEAPPLGERPKQPCPPADVAIGVPRHP